MGYVDKASSIDEFLRAVDKVLCGKKYVSPNMEEYLAEQVADRYTRKQCIPLHENLSKRELQVMLYLVQGLTQTEIARKLHISRKTIYTYKASIFEKMNVKNLKGLIIYALMHGHEELYGPG